MGAPGAISWSGMAFVKRSSASINDDDDWKHSLAESVAVGRKTFHPPTRYYSYLGGWWLGVLRVLEKGRFEMVIIRK